MANGVAADISGPTVCSLDTPAERDAVLRRLGPDPLRADAAPTVAIRRWQSSRAPIGRLLLDQSVVCGIGNVYRAEVLFLAGVHPERSGLQLSDSEAAFLWAETVRQLRMGVRSGRIVTVDPVEVGMARRRITRADSTYVYGRDTSRRCGSAVRRWDLGARHVFACETCQT